MQTDVFFQQLGIGTVVFGAADRKGGAVIFQGFGVHGKKHDEVIGLECGDDGATGGFQTNGHGLALETLTQLGYPLVNGLRGLGQLEMLAFGTLSRTKPQVVFSVGPIPSHRRCKLIYAFHCWFN